jgi:hypothetical protein
MIRTKALAEIYQLGELRRTVFVNTSDEAKHKANEVGGDEIRYSIQQGDDVQASYLEFIRANNRWHRVI